MPLAVGAALTSKLKKLGRVAVAFFGDGGANQGVLHESMNLASVWKLPVIFCCENNQYAESTSVEYALSTAHVADRAAGYDMPGIHVDGMDVFAVYDAAEQAVARARAGDGPTLIECLTYRYYGHTVFDNPLTYRTKEEEELWRKPGPYKGFSRNCAPVRRNYRGGVGPDRPGDSGLDGRGLSSSPTKALFLKLLSCTTTYT